MQKTRAARIASKLAAKEQYTVVAELLKSEAGVRRHYTHKIIGGLAWTDEAKILAPEGVTRRQLYVLAHECAHVVLHSGAVGSKKPGHIKEHEAETYAHRALQRYGIEVPEKSAQWARAYVGQWIMKDRAAGIPICPMAVEFASGRRSPYDPLPSVDGQPPTDFSKTLERFIDKGKQTVQLQEAATLVELAKAPPPLTADEAEMLKKLMATAYRLERRRIPKSFEVVAIAVEEVEQAKRRGLSALPALARGINSLQMLRIAHRSSRLADVRAILSREDSFAFYGPSIVANACFCLSWAGLPYAFYAGVFFASLAALFVLHVMLKIWSR